MARQPGRVTGYVGLALALLELCAYGARDPVRDLLGHTASAWVLRRLQGTLVQAPGGAWNLAGVLALQAPAPRPAAAAGELPAERAGGAFDSDR